ncbi:MAG: selenide, water dikinase SelD [Desulfobacterales bacterium]|nr:selenide, water dikinase SelD [Desulfobacterales bacterium]
MSDALSTFAPPDDVDLLVGYDTADDAAVYRMSPELAMINTVDFITPPVDDPWWFGQIAAANSLSDIYSMGGRPLTALNLVMFPSKVLDMGILKEILKGGHDKVVEANAALAGGHSVDDEEPKYGLCVNGVVHPDRILTNAGGQVGDTLILTKPIGSGVLFNAVRSGKLDFATLEREALPEIAALNDKALEAALAHGAHALTDVTGFGILGHLGEMSQGCGQGIQMAARALPVYPHALDMYERGETTGSNSANETMVISRGLDLDPRIRGAQRDILFDPQTSGGLVIALPDNEANGCLETLKEAGLKDAAKIGHILDSPPGLQVV